MLGFSLPLYYEVGVYGLDDGGSFSLSGRMMSMVRVYCRICGFGLLVSLLSLALSF